MAIQDARPANCLRATATPSTGGVVLYGGCARDALATAPEPRTLQDIFNDWGESWVWDHLDGADDLDWLTTAIRDGTVELITDGSHQPQLARELGGAGWVIECTRTGRRVRGAIRTTTTTANAYRSELTGLYGGLAFLLAFCRLHHISSGSARVGCDNEKALWLSSQLSQRVSPKRAHSDTIRAIRLVRAMIPITLRFGHVRGHQDETVLYDDLDRRAQLNIEMDILAKEYVRAEWLHGAAAPEALPHERVVCRVAGHKVTGDVGPAIRNERSRKIMRTFLTSKGKLTTAAFDDVDWTAIEMMMDSVPQLFALWTCKHVSKFCGTNRNLVRWRRATSDRCPCCDHPDVSEDTLHQMHCPAPSRQALFHDDLDTFRRWLETNDTEPQLTVALLSYTRNKGALRFQDIPGLPSTLQEAAAAQDIIGWDNFIEGKITQSIRHFQANYLRDVSSRRTPNRWTAGLVEQLLTIVHSQWVHRNEIVHRRERDGLRTAEHNQLKTRLEQELARGTDGMDSEDHHLMEKDFASLWALPGSDKKIWLRAVQIARGEDITTELPVPGQRRTERQREAARRTSRQSRTLQRATATRNRTLTPAERTAVRRSVAQQRRRARERLEQGDTAAGGHSTPAMNTAAPLRRGERRLTPAERTTLRRSAAQRRRRERERVLRERSPAVNRAERGLTPEERISLRRSEAQRRRRERERESRERARAVHRAGEVERSGTSNPDLRGSEPNNRRRSSRAVRRDIEGRRGKRQRTSRRGTKRKRRDIAHTVGNFQEERVNNSTLSSEANLSRRPTRRSKRNC